MLKFQMPKNASSSEPRTNSLFPAPYTVIDSALIDLASLLTINAETPSETGPKIPGLRAASTSPRRSRAPRAP